MGRRRVHNVTLPSGVHRHRSRTGKVRFYWRPHRGTCLSETSVRLPDDPSSPEFWREVERLRNPPLEEPGGIAAMIAAYFASPHFDQLAASTQREYRRYLDAFGDRLGRFDPDAIEPKHLAALRDEYGETPAKLTPT
jgi:hypothetical protein